uniref:Uncharacterized protein n=1 Tax=Knipowitschia caucasica TaxID=637954 RepID=A0AAV2JST9_KNICA
MYAGARERNGNKKLAVRYPKPLQNGGRGTQRSENGRHRLLKTFQLGQGASRGLAWARERTSGLHFARRPQPTHLSASGEVPNSPPSFWTTYTPARSEREGQRPPATQRHHVGAGNTERDDN